MNNDYALAADKASKAGADAHKQGSGALHKLAASQHRIAAEYASQAGLGMEEKMHRNHAGMHDKAAIEAEEMTDGGGGEEVSTRAAKAQAFSKQLGSIAAARMEKNAALVASVKGNGYSLTDLQQAVATKYKDLDDDEDEEDGMTPYCSCYVADIIAPAHEQGEVWSAIVQDEDCLYTVQFKINADHEVELVGEPVEVQRSTDYDYVAAEAKEAKAANEKAALEAGAPMGNRNAAKDKSATSVGAKHSSEMADRASDKAEGSDSVARHAKAALAHEDAYHQHNEVARKAAESGDRGLEHRHAAAAKYHMSMAAYHDHAGKKLTPRGFSENAKDTKGEEGLEAGAPMGNDNAAKNHQYKDGGEAASKAEAATKEAERASMVANRSSANVKRREGGGFLGGKTDSMHERASDLHERAAVAHEKAEDAHKAAADQATDRNTKMHHVIMQDEHNEKSDKHSAISDDHDHGIRAKEIKAPAGAIECRNVKFAKQFTPLPELTILPLDAKAANPVEEGIMMYMPGGVFTIHPSQDGNPVTVAVMVNEASAATMERQRKALESKGKKPFFSVQHETEIAAFWPTEFFWGERADATGARRTGVWARGMWTKSGKEAVEGKDFRTFSPTFFVDSLRTDERNPAVIICNEDARANMGALENDPAFQAMSPLWCSNAKGAERMDIAAPTTKTLVLVCHEELRDKNPTLYDVRKAMWDRHRIRLSEEEVSRHLIPVEAGAPMGNRNAAKDYNHSASVAYEKTNSAQAASKEARSHENDGSDASKALHDKAADLHSDAAAAHREAKDNAPTGLKKEHEQLAKEHEQRSQYHNGIAKGTLAD